MHEAHEGEDTSTGDEAEGSRVNRRTMIAASAGVAAAAWVAPTVLSMSAAAAQSGPFNGCFPFDTDLEGWAGNGSWVTHLGSGALQPGNGTGGVISSPVIPTNGATSVTLSLDYSSDGGCGFFGINCYANANGTGFIGEIWVFGATTNQGTWGNLVVLPSGVVSSWQSFSHTFALLGGTQSMALKAENFTLEPDPNFPSFFRNACYT